MKTLRTYLFEVLNQQFYPKKGCFGKFRLFYGGHTFIRQDDRNISDDEIIKTLIKIYDYIKQDFENNKISINKSSNKDNEFTILDYRNNKCVILCCFLRSNEHTNKNSITLSFPDIVVKSCHHKRNYKQYENNRKYYIYDNEIIVK